MLLPTLLISNGLKIKKANTSPDAIASSANETIRKTLRKSISGSKQDLIASTRTMPNNAIATTNANGNDQPDRKTIIPSSFRLVIASLIPNFWVVSSGRFFILASQAILAFPRLSFVESSTTYTATTSTSWEFSRNGLETNSLSLSRVQLGFIPSGIERSLTTPSIFQPLEIVKPRGSK